MVGRFPERSRKLLVCGLTVVLTAATVGCGSSKSKTATSDSGSPIKIGYLSSLAGGCAAASEDRVEGAQQAVNTINAHGGVMGHLLQLLVHEYGDEPASGINEGRDLVLAERVSFLAGACTSAVAKGVARLVAEPRHIVYVVGVTDPTVFKGGGYVFGTVPTAAIEGANAAAYVRGRPQWKTIAVIGQDNGYGHEVTAAFRKGMRGSPQKIVSQEYAASGASSYGSYVGRLVAEKPDVTYSTVTGEDATTFVRQALSRGLFKATQLFGILDYGTIAAMPEPPIGALGYTYYPPASIYHTPFSEQLRPLGEIADSGMAGDGFNQIEIIAQGIEKAKSTEPQAVRAALEDATVQLVQGPERIHSCNNLTAVPIAMGPVVAATNELPSAHFSPVQLVDTNKYFSC